MKNQKKATLRWPHITLDWICVFLGVVLFFLGFVKTEPFLYFLLGGVSFFIAVVGDKKTAPVSSSTTISPGLYTVRQLFPHISEADLPKDLPTGDLPEEED